MLGRVRSFHRSYLQFTWMISLYHTLLYQSFVVLYALYDILLMVSSISELQLLFQTCEHELTLIEMCINVMQTCYMRIGIKHDVVCANII